MNAVVFLRPKVMADAERRKGGDDGDMFIEKYPARPFERWAHAFHLRRLWFYDPKQKALWRGRFNRHEIWKEESSWRSSEGEEMSAGGFYRVAKQWKELTLWGPYSPNQVRIKIKKRKTWQTDRYRLPTGRIAYFVTEGETDS